MLMIYVHTLQIMSIALHHVVGCAERRASPLFPAQYGFDINQTDFDSTKQIQLTTHRGSMRMIQPNNWVSIYLLFLGIGSIHVAE